MGVLEVSTCFQWMKQLVFTLSIYILIKIDGTMNLGGFFIYYSLAFCQTIDSSNSNIFHSLIGSYKFCLSRDDIPRNFRNILPKISVPFDFPPRISGIVSWMVCFFSNSAPSRFSVKFPTKFPYHLSQSRSQDFSSSCPSRSTKVGRWETMGTRLHLPLFCNFSNFRSLNKKSPTSGYRIKFSSNFPQPTI